MGKNGMEELIYQKPCNDEQHWQGIYHWDDMSGIEFDEDTIFREVELKPVTRMDWVVKNPD